MKSNLFDRVVISANEYANFIEFWPLVTAAWKKWFQVPVTLAFVTKRDKTDPLVEDLTRYGEVVLFNEIDGIPTTNQTKVARHFLATQYSSEVCLINDIDLIPLQRNYLTEKLRQRKPGELLTLGFDWYQNTPHHGKFPIAYLTAEGTTFRECFNPQNLNFEELLDSWKGLQVFDHKEAIDNDPAIFSDESLLRLLVDRWTDKHRVRHVARGFWPYTQRALDRADWYIDIDKLKKGVYVEAHMLRPLHRYKKELMPLINYTVLDDDNYRHYWQSIEAELKKVQTGPISNPITLAYSHYTNQSHFGAMAARVSQGITPPNSSAEVTRQDDRTTHPAASVCDKSASFPIAIVTETLNYVSGGVRCIVGALNRLKRRGFETVCYVTHPDLRCEWLNAEFPILPVAQFQNFRGIAISPYSPTAEIVAKSEAIGKFYWVHSYEPKFPELTGRPDSWRIMSEASYRFDELQYIAVSSYLKMILELIYGRNVLTTLAPGGVDTGLFRPGPKSKNRLRVLFLSREHAFRGAEDIIQALDLIRKQGTELDVYVMGYPLEMGRIPHKLFSPLPQPEFAQLLGTMDIFVHASQFEGFGLPPLEAMACKCAVIATYVGASDYLLDGYNALVVPPGRPDKIAAALTRLANDTGLRQTLAEGGIQTVRNGYTWEHTVDRLEEALAEGMTRAGYGSSVQLNAAVDRHLVPDTTSRFNTPSKMTDAPLSDTTEIDYLCGQARQKATETVSQQMGQPDVASKSGDALPGTADRTKLYAAGQYRVSAIVSVYNAERFIRGCLIDLENQTIADQVEIIIVNSGSQQNEASIIREFQSQYDNIKYVRTDQRESVYAAWNRGIQAAAGKYITNANADDRHAAYALERLAGVLDVRPDIALVYANQWITETENETFDAFSPVGKFEWKDYDPLTLTEGCYIGPQPMWRKDLHAQYGYFDECLESAGDWEFWLRISEAEKMLHLNEVLGLYLRSPKGIENRDLQLSLKEFRQIKQRYARRNVRSKKIA